MNGGLFQCTADGARVCVVNGPREIFSAEGPFPAANCFDEEDNNCNKLTDQADPACFGDEACDGRDNDGDTEVDEDFTLGGDCTVGQGFCARTGGVVCKADGSGVECGVVAGQPVAEGPPGGARCGDLVDNDCDGLGDLERSRLPGR